MRIGDMPEPRDRNDRKSDQLEERARGWIRIIAGAVLLLLIVLVVIVDAFGGPSGFKPNEIIFAGIIGAFLVVLGLEGASFLVRRQ